MVVIALVSAAIIGLIGIPIVYVAYHVGYHKAIHDYRVIQGNKQDDNPNGKPKISIVCVKGKQ